MYGPADKQYRTARVGGYLKIIDEGFPNYPCLGLGDLCLVLSLEEDRDITKTRFWNVSVLGPVKRHDFKMSDRTFATTFTVVR